VTTFNYTTGNPNNLVGGGAASMVDVQGPFVDLKAFINGGVLDEANVPNLSAAFTTYKTIAWGGSTTPGTSFAIASFIMPGGPSATAATGIALPGGANTGSWAFYLDPTEWAANTRTTKLRTRWGCITNAVAPGISFTCGLFPVATFGGASGANPMIASIGAVLTGSTVTFTTPSASNGGATQASTDFNAPAAGWYCFGVGASGVGAANSTITLTVTLMMRQV
jgi:hypothetical protein